MGNKITLKLQNFKQYSTKEFEGEGNLFVFIGHNGSGKSSAIQSIETCLMAKGFVKDPIKTNEKEAGIVLKFQSKDDEPIQITTSITGDGIYEFFAAYIKDGKAKKISDPKKIRELIGNYYPLTVESTLTMTSSAEGRRKFIAEYLLPQIEDVKRNRLVELKNNISDKSNKTTENNWYFTRRKLQTELTGVEGELKASVLSDEDKAIIASKDRVIKKLNELKAEKELHKNDLIIAKDIYSALSAISKGYEILITLETFQNTYHVDFIAERESIENKINKLNKTTEKGLEGLYDRVILDNLDEQITRGNAKLTEITTLEKRTTNEEAKERKEKLFNQINELNDKIEEAKKEIKLIYKNSSLPAGLEIEDDNIILNGFQLDINSNSETEIKLAICELLFTLNTSGFVNLGDFSSYDDASLDKIIALAKKNKALVLGQRVTNDESVDLQTIIIDK